MSGSLLVAGLCLVMTVSAGPDAGPPPLPDVDLTSLPDSIRAEVEAARDRALASDRDAAAAGELGALYFVYDFPLAATSCFERAAAIDAENIRWRYFLGLAEERVGDAGKAIAAYEAAVAIDGDDGPSLVRLADLLLEKDPSRSESLYRHALEVDPDNAPAWYGLGHCAKIAGDRQEALARYRVAVEKAPEYAEAHYAIAMILASQGDKDAAAAHLKISGAGVQARIPGDPLYTALLNKGRSAVMMRHEAQRLAEAGRVGEAIEQLKQAIEVDVSGTTSRHYLGLLLAQQGRFEEAVEQLRQVVKADPGNVEAKSTLGLALTELSRLDEAQAIFRDVLQRHPDHASTLMYLGHVLAQLGRTEEALGFMRRAVEAQPANGVFQYTLGELLARSGGEAEAIDHLKKAVQQIPGNAGYRYTLGVLLARAGDVSGAREQWLQAVAIRPDLPAPYRGLVGAALSENDSAAAVRYAEKLCALTRRSRREDLEMLATAYEAAGRDGDAVKVRSESERLTEAGPPQ